MFSSAHWIRLPTCFDYSMNPEYCKKLSDGCEFRCEIRATNVDHSPSNPRSVRKDYESEGLETSAKIEKLGWKKCRTQTYDSKIVQGTFPEVGSAERLVSLLSTNARPGIFDSRNTTRGGRVVFAQATRRPSFFKQSFRRIEIYQFLYTISHNFEKIRTKS